MLDTFDTGPIHMDVDTETGELNVRYFVHGPYTPAVGRHLARFFGKHYADKPAHDVDVTKFAVQHPRKAK
jgi:hypothetical protein